MKTIHLAVAIILLGITVSAQQPQPEKLLAEHNANKEKISFTLPIDDFTKLSEEELNGSYTLLQENGKVAEIRSFAHGKLDGTWVQYDDEQNIIAIANYKENLKHGKWIIWDKNGTKRYEIEYEAGRRTGTWKSWDEHGKLKHTEAYK